MSSEDVFPTRADEREKRPRVAPRYPDEAGRMAALRRYGILDTEPDETFDRISRIAASALDMPISAVSFTDQHRQWFKASRGLPGNEVDRSHAMCAHAILSDEPLVVIDMRRDERFADNPLVVGEPGLRFYAGAPLITPEGHRVGTVCVLDTRPRPDFTARDREVLVELARMTMDQLEMQAASRSAIDLAEELEGVEQELAAMTRHLQTFVHKAPAPVAILDRQLRYVAHSERWISDYRLDGSSLIGRCHYDVFPEIPQRWKALHRRALAGEALSCDEDRFERADGTVDWIHWELSPWSNTAGEVVGIVMFTEVITERVKALETLRAKEAQYRELYNNTPAMMLSVDPDGRLVAVSDYWLKHMGYGRDEVMGRPAAEFLAPSSRAQAEEIGFPAFGRGGPSSEVALKFIKNDGSVIDTVLSAVAERGEDGKLDRTLAVITDVTDKVRTEAHLRQSQKLEAVGQLTGGVAHDFNNLLAVILGNIELIQSDAVLDGDTQKRLNAMSAASQRGAEMIRQLLMFSRRQVLRSDVTNVNDIINGMHGLLLHTLGEHIAIRCDLDAGVWACRTDPAQLEAAIINLCINSRDAMPQGGQLTISTGNATLGADHAATRSGIEPGAYVEISVTDCGTGIPESVLPHILEPFFTTKEPGVGTGLGLSMVYGFVKQSHGHISIYSETGRGTTIRLYLPREVLPTEHAGMEPLAPPVGGSERVLLVEDSTEVREVAAAVLRKAGYEVVEADSGPSAVGILTADDRFDLLFTDVAMPGGMTGAQLAQQVAARVPGIKVLYASGYAGRSLESIASVARDDNFIGKPFARDTMLRKVREVLDR